MENIKAYIRIKPVLEHQDAITCDKIDDTTVINYKTEKTYSFGNKLLEVNTIPLNINLRTSLRFRSHDRHYLQPRWPAACG